MKYGWLKDPVDPRDYTTNTPRMAPFLVKSTPFDGEGVTPPSKHIISCLPGIKTQGNIGSCTAHAGTTMYETFLRLQGYDILFDRLFLYKLARRLSGLEGDTGAHLRTTMQAIALFGLPSEKYNPYNERLFDAEPTAFSYALAQNYKAITYYRLDPPGKSADKVINSIKVNLATNRACIFGYAIFAGAETDGNINTPTKQTDIDGYHAVCAVGYDDAYIIGDNVGAFYSASSWGTSWGQGGYGWLPYTYVTRRFATDWWTMMSGNWVNMDIFH